MIKKGISQIKIVAELEIFVDSENRTEERETGPTIDELKRDVISRIRPKK